MSDTQKIIYTIFLNGKPIDAVELSGIAHLELASTNLIGTGDLVKFIYFRFC